MLSVDGRSLQLKLKNILMRMYEPKVALVVICCVHIAPMVLEPAVSKYLSIWLHISETLCVPPTVA